MGTKLLVYEVRTCINLLNEVTKVWNISSGIVKFGWANMFTLIALSSFFCPSQGHSLTRRERKQLLRTASDLLR